MEWKWKYFIHWFYYTSLNTSSLFHRRIYRHFRSTS